MALERPNKLERCPGFDSLGLEPNRTITIVPNANREYLTDKQLVDYYELRKSYLTYLVRLGKNPDKAAGYSPYTVCNTGRRTAKFDLWTWKNNIGYTMPPTQDDAQAYMEKTAFRDVSNSTKGKVMEALLRYSGWLTKRFDRDEWEFSWTFQSGGNNNAPRDFLSREERRLIRQAALEKDGTPSYGIDPREIPNDNDHSWKYTSLVWVSLDSGLRPVEVGRAKTS